MICKRSTGFRLAEPGPSGRRVFPRVLNQDGSIKSCMTGGVGQFQAAVMEERSGAVRYKIGDSVLRFYADSRHELPSVQLADGNEIPQKSLALSSCSTNSMAYVGTPCRATICEITRAETSTPRLFFTDKIEPTSSSRCSWTAAPCLFRLVAVAGIVKGDLCLS